MKHPIPFILLFLYIFLGCSKDAENSQIEDTPETLTTQQKEVVSYFKEVALGFEFGNASAITRKWDTNVKLFVGGNPTTELLTELELIVSEINALTTDGQTLEIVADQAASNFFVFFGSGDAYADIYPSQSGLVAANFGLFSISWNAANFFTSGQMYVDIFRANLTEQKHLLREELTQSLGLAKDSTRFEDSIFQQSFATKTTTYSAIDRELIRLLYHPQMRAGLDGNQAEAVITEILLSETN